MLNLSSEWTSYPLERAFLGYKIGMCKARLERAGFIEAHALRNAISLLSNIRNEPAFLQAPRDYLANWVEHHSDEILTIQKIAEAIQECGEAVSQCRL